MVPPSHFCSFCLVLVAVAVGRNESLLLSSPVPPHPHCLCATCFFLSSNYVSLLTLFFLFHKINKGIIERIPHLVEEPFHLIRLLLLLLRWRQEGREDAVSSLEDDNDGDRFRNGFAPQHGNRMHTQVVK